MAQMCQNCGLPLFSGAAGLSMPQRLCQCSFRPVETPWKPADGQTYVPRPLTEDDVRRIVREELARTTKTEGAQP